MLTTPCLDVSSKKLDVTFAEPIKAEGTDKVAAVAGADVSLDAVIGIVAAIRRSAASSRR